jgi:hypothetical protein
MRQDGLVLRPVVPSFCGCSAWKFNHNLAKSLGLTLELRVFAAPDQIFATMGQQRSWHMLRILLVALSIVYGDLSNEVGLGHVDSEKSFLNAGLFAHHAHGVFQTFEGEGEHAVAHELLNDSNALAVLPYALGLGVDPSIFGEGVCQAL